MDTYLGQKPPRSSLDSGEDTPSPHEFYTRLATELLPYTSQQAGQQSSCLDYTTAMFAFAGDWEKEREIDGQHGQFSSKLPNTVTSHKTLDVAEDERRFQQRQPCAAVAREAVERQGSELQSKRRSGDEKELAPLHTHFPASPVVPQLCVTQTANESEQHASSIPAFLWDDTQSASQDREGLPQKQQSSHTAEQQGSTVVETQQVKNYSSIVEQLLGRNYSHDTVRDQWSLSPCDEMNARVERRHVVSKSQEASAFICALHALLASGELFEETACHSTTELAAEEVPLQSVHDPQDCQQNCPTATQHFDNSASLFVGALVESHLPCTLHSEGESPESVLLYKETKDATCTAVGKIGGLAARHLVSDGASSDRTSYCSGITTSGRNLSTYAGISFDQSISYTSGGSFAFKGYPSKVTISAGRSVELENEGVKEAACSLSHGSTCLPPTSYNEGTAGTTALCQGESATATAVPAGVMTEIRAKECVKKQSEASRFQKLVSAFYAENSRHSVLWNDSQRLVPSTDSSKRGHLNKQRETWKAAAGIVEVTQQVKALVRRLRGLQLVTREVAAIPDTSGDALCCCLSGDLTSATTVDGKTTTGSSGKWKFEQLLVLSVLENGLSESVLRRHDERHTDEPSEMSDVSCTAVRNFQIQDEVFVVSPAQDSHVTTSEALTFVSSSESIAIRQLSDTMQEGGGKGNTSTMVRSPILLKGSRHRYLVRHGWPALLERQAQSVLCDHPAVPKRVFGRGVRDSRRGATGLTSRQLLEALYGLVEATPSCNRRSADCAVGKNESMTPEESVSSRILSVFHPQHPSKQMSTEGASCLPKPQHHRTSSPSVTNTASQKWTPAPDREVDRNDRTEAEEFASQATAATTSGSRFPAELTSRLPKPPNIVQTRALTNPQRPEAFQLSLAQEFETGVRRSLPYNVTQHRHLSPRRAPERRCESAHSLISTALPGAASFSFKELMDALSHCLQDFTFEGSSSSCENFDRNPATDSGFRTYGSSKSSPPVQTLQTGCELPPEEPTSNFLFSSTAGSQHNTGTFTTTFSNRPVLGEWQTEKASAMHSPRGRTPLTSGGVDTGVLLLSSPLGKSEYRNKIWGGQGQETGASRKRASRQRSPKSFYRRENVTETSTSRAEELLQSGSYSRECCTVFVSWVPRAARADNIKQKVPMERRLKLLLQMKLGVRGIVCVTLFPPRGSHCCVLFESPAAASAFIQEYGGSTYTSTTEHFKTNICEAYAVATDRGIERVFIRIEEFKPHVLQQHLLQQTRDCRHPDDWHERRTGRANNLHHHTGERWRRPTSAASSQSSRMHVNSSTPASLFQPLGGSSSVQLPCTRGVAHGAISATCRAQWCER